MPTRPFDDRQSATAAPGTPDDVHILADWHRRVYAAFVDFALFLLIVAIGAAFGGVDSVLGRLLTVVAFGFWLWNLWTEGVLGQTVGKRVVGLKLVAVRDAGVIGPGRAIARGFAHFADALFLVGIFWPLWDEHRQTFADKLCGTVVIQGVTIEPTAG